MTLPSQDTADIRKELSQALNVNIPWDAADEVLTMFRSVRPIVFSGLGELAHDYVATCLTRHTRQQTFITPEEFVTQRRIVATRDVLAEESSKSKNKRQRCSSHEIRKQLLTTPTIIPSSFAIRTRYQVTQRTAENIRASLIAVLKALRDLNLYTHATLDASTKFSQLGRKPRE